MATLVLTVVGNLVGGPIGGAIGAVLGQTIDRDVLFTPPGRQGPRLTELKLQTSSYGTQIPKVFGAMRVAGCVIWATDLIEGRATSRAGKGQPTVTTYSYSASLAVALSGRTIRSVGRIWADGKLLRGAGGDFKVSTGFRLHLGDEDQQADPLLASAEGVGATPAHRGIAYAVFENLQLADYGNRIPSLTFEVIADDGPVTTGAIAAALADGAIDGAGATLALHGFAASGDSARGVIDTLATADGAWFAPAGGGLAMIDTPRAPVVIADAGTRAERGSGAVAQRSIAASESVARAISVVHYDPARDYQTGVQRAQRPGAGRREERIELPLALAAGTARTIAEAVLARKEAARVRRHVALGWSGLTIGPGACVAIGDEAPHYRVTSWSLEHMVLTLDCVALAEPGLALSGSPGRPLPAPDVVIGTTIVHPIELPSLDDLPLTNPRLSVAAAGTGEGWRSAALLWSADDGASWNPAGATAAPAVLGTIDVPAGPGASSIEDRRNVMDVTLATAAMTLANADSAALDAGANVAVAGRELFQFGHAEPIGECRWRLSRLRRGRRGSEGAIGTAAVGDGFFLVERDAVATIDLPASTLGATVLVMASGVGDAAPVISSVIVTGASVTPPPPVAPTVAGRESGDAVIAWTRRSRGGWAWGDGVEAPLVEERERYAITITPADGPTRQVESDNPSVTITAAERAAGPAVVTIRQLGTVAPSAPTTLTID